MIKDIIRDNIIEVLNAHGYTHEREFVVEIPNNQEFGDYSSNAALVLSKENKTAPKPMAETLIKDLKTSSSESGDGCLIHQFTLTCPLSDDARTIHGKGEDYAATDLGKGERSAEFVSANPTGPLNIVSARAAAFGDTLYRIMKFVGYDPAREFYINDAGNQVDILAESLELRLRELQGERIGDFPYEAYHGEYVKHLAQRLNAVEGVRVFMMTEKDRMDHLKEFALSELLEMQRLSLEKFGVVFDGWVSEKTLRAEGVVEEVLSYLTEADCTYEKEDAIWFRSTDFGDDKDRVLMKSDGSITYFVPDLAYHLTKIQRGYSTLIDIFGPDHHGYVPRLKAAFKALNMTKRC